MKKIHIAIIEDDKELLRGITRTLSNCADIVVEATYSNAEDFIKEVNELKFDPV